MPARRYINLPNRRPELPFSDAVLVGDTLYISGRIGLDPNTGKVPTTPIARPTSCSTSSWTFSSTPA